MTFQFDSLSAFISMAGHGLYVWASYGVTVAALVYLAIEPVFARKHFVKTQKALHKRKHHS